MPILSIDIKTSAPLFLNGATPRDNPELRASSVRGHLRYWFRAILGTRSADLAKIYERETALFGNTSVASQVSIRFYARSAVNTERAEMLPHRQDRRAPQLAIDEGQPIRLEICTRPGVEIPKEVLVALEVWLLLGGLGKRSRRMFGSLEPLRLRFDSNEFVRFWQPPMTSSDVLIDHLANVLGKFAPTPSKLANVYAGGVPSFPTLNPFHSRIVVGGSVYVSAKEANIDLFKLLRSDKFRPNEDVFGYAKQRARRASPLIAQVRQIGPDQYCPVLTIMRSSDLDPKKWAILNTFLDDYTSHYGGTKVWGL